MNKLVKHEKLYCFLYILWVWYKFIFVERRFKNSQKCWISHWRMRNKEEILCSLVNFFFKCSYLQRPYCISSIINKQSLYSTDFQDALILSYFNICTFIAFFFFRIKAFTSSVSLHSEKQKSLNVSGIILPPRMLVGRKGRVTLSIEGRQVGRVQTAWFLNNTPIFDTSHTGRAVYFF